MDYLEFTEYVKQNYETLNNIGIGCDHCKLRRNCRLHRKSVNIESVLGMQEDESSFPKWTVRFVQNHPGLLKAVPAFVYTKMYGYYDMPQFGCLFHAKEIISHLNEVKKTYELLKDEVSKAIYLNVLTYRMTLDDKYINEAKSSNSQYFIPPFCGGFDEVYVDCGAYIGDTFQEYCNHNSFPKIAYLFEPDKNNLCRIEELVPKYERSTDVRIIRKGLYKHSGELYFKENKNGSSSFLAEESVEGSVKLDVTTIDDSIDGKVDFIKMDIEGSETDAILGAKRTISTFYPKLAICIYHYINNLWDLPLMIHEMFPEYANYEVRHYTNNFSETVLYVYK